MLLLILYIAIGGLIVGALGRLIVPGPNPMGVLATIGVGVLGAFLGAIVARVIWPHPELHILGLFLLEVLGAALIVLLISGRRRRVRVY
ncbi:MAG: hypothetical protein M3N98_13335 [Actinomycetota bacterium]|nr:hypothetical protein [Actinomycetota bacterium]